jgi:hypothetical protein
MTNYTEYQLSVLQSLAKEKAQEKEKRPETCQLTGVILD